MQSRIFIMGSGVVGTATGEGFVAGSHDVTFVDVAASRVRALRARGLDARVSLDLCGEPDSIVFLTLPTPHLPRRYDLGLFAKGVVAVGQALAEAAPSGAKHTVVVRSTVPPGTTEGMVRDLLDQHAPGVEYRLASNPEFLRAVSAAEDFLHPWMTVVGSRDPHTVEQLRALLTPFGGELRVFDDPAETEFIKCAHNAFNATKISFWNEMWTVARAHGIELDPLAATVARSAEGSINPEYGIRGGAPYGGACLPKDTHGFLGFAATVGVDMPLLEAVIEVNDRVAVQAEPMSVPDIVATTAGSAATLAVLGA